MTSHNFGRTFKKPMRPYEKERIHNELKVVGEYGLKNKRELWRVHYSLAKIRKAARTLLTLPENDTKRIFEGTALLNRLTKLGVLDETKQKLDYVLSLTVNDLLDRRLQTQVHKTALARSVHHARTLINHRHISVYAQLVNQPAFLVWKENESNIHYAENSVLTTEKPGRKRRLKIKSANKKNEVNDDSD
ncbi:40S ribosomal protein S9-1 [Tritrichomonas foetus]|uniref:40S ribosomal protein S9-1 n=1 Tax=Tritrichomonas foetus TaxID=1144522 RepID=A0A1J4JBS9_9EUKA|nr:40S ribosomal protein S9-1 [Tritrichomonas foetus]OHS94708.1 40S ribosomal protein S9-1 [Tritrichomonas foetus]|eukprot:OHS94708.1 40S ribosomal protein S9-1 [Tritrichomonas foetus]